MGHWPNHTMSSGAKEKRWEQIRLETAVFWLIVKCSLELLIWSKELLCCGLDQFKIIPGFFPNISLSLTLSACNFSLAREDSEFTHSFVIPCLPILPFQSQISSHNISSYRIPATLSQKHNGWVRKKNLSKRVKCLRFSSTGNLTWQNTIMPAENCRPLGQTLFTALTAKGSATELSSPPTHPHTHKVAQDELNETCTCWAVHCREASNSQQSKSSMSANR